MTSVTRFKYRFIPTVFMSLVTLVVFILFVALGVWQLNRSHEKQAMLNKYEMLSKKTPKLFTPLDGLPEQYEPLQVRGVFLPTVFLLDNQHVEHQLGFDALSPLLVDKTHVILVDRGFVPIQTSRIDLPSINTPTGQLSVRGTSYYPSEKNWVLGQSSEIRSKNLVIIEKIDAKWISHFLHKSVYPFISRLHANEPNGFHRVWATVAMPPARHIGYAVQWFSMAFVVLILFVVLNLKKDEIYASK